MTFDTLIYLPNLFRLSDQINKHTVPQE